MNDVLTKVLPIPHQSEQVALVAMIERLARDPATDLAKLRELLDFKRQVVADAARAAYDRAFVQLQGKLDPVAMRGVIDIGRGKAQKYAKFEDLHASIRIPLLECGFGLSFRITEPREGIVSVTTILAHEDGHREETTIPLPYDTTGSKNSVQSRGSSISYGRRYGAMAVLNLATVDEDDDGQAGGGSAPISIEQLQELDKLVVESRANLKKFCQYMGVDKLEMLRADKYEEAVQELRVKIADNKKKADAAAQAKADAAAQNAQPQQTGTGHEDR